MACLPGKAPNGERTRHRHWWKCPSIVAPLEESGKGNPRALARDCGAGLSGGGIFRSKACRVGRAFVAILVKAGAFGPAADDFVSLGGQKSDGSFKGATLFLSLRCERHESPHLAA